jgi:hypothetical protein
MKNEQTINQRMSEGLQNRVRDAAKWSLALLKSNYSALFSTLYSVLFVPLALSLNRLD